MLRALCSYIEASLFTRTPVPQLWLELRKDETEAVNVDRLTSVPADKTDICRGFAGSVVKSQPHVQLLLDGTVALGVCVLDLLCALLQTDRLAKRL